jgi:predicted neuraminidase
MINFLPLKRWSRLCLFLLLPVCSLLKGQQNDFIVEEDLLFPLQEKHVHGSSVVALPNGDLLTAWFEGSGERHADDVLIRGARWRKATRTWSEPFDLADTPGLPDCNPVLFLDRDQKLFLVWIAVQANKWENSILRYRTTMDYSGPGAPVWQWQDNILLKPDESFAKEVADKLGQLPEHQTGWAEYAPPYDQMIREASENPTYRSIGWMTRIPPLILPEGRILLPLYSDGLNLSLVAISDDGGTTWRSSHPIVGRGPIQPALVRKENGEIIAYMRDSGDAPPRVQISRSTDQGITWSPALKSDIPNTASVAVIRLDDGRWALVGNTIEDGRYQLSLWISENEGKNWNQRFFLEHDETRRAGFSYPCLIQDNDGFIHLTYSYHQERNQKSIKYLKLDPRKIKK